MNIKLVESLALVVQSLSPEERSLLEEKLKARQQETSAAGKDRPFYETATPEERAKAFREWAASHPRNQPSLSDEAISRESIYGERG
ncbi:MAG: hypothetical protein P5702_06595 [Limnospira sp. PMC 1291.21]|uniref:Uncharacterized protein n=3 Tax=Limnospira TaxID=2596745 RepID=A0A9P1KDQ0_9CYAN|nr:MULTISPECIES: hypothetical protein [Limnospira]EKD11240.1 hypothetical protein SPLC1_S030700 [Arthrospira platensis C1]MDY7052968.1 hypothetical protein [Limnospira fusiformis LS22]QJB27449.1 hypothetical protein HFV01_18785 [Limnospira fusiformis SAG 85.79]RAQ41543.1 hypothetical protein B9S53_13325 [Arthrospira sp. O9.13F]EDZ94328.1 conserved hypothetical protein [Limnospira maxima CS-328]